MKRTYVYNSHKNAMQDKRIAKLERELWRMHDERATLVGAFAIAMFVGFAVMGVWSYLATVSAIAVPYVH